MLYLHGTEWPPTMIASPNWQRLRATACWQWLLVFFVGCQTPPARPAAGPAEGDHSSRCLVLTRQILEDTALQASLHPIETGCLVGASSVAWAGQAGREFFAKRCLSPLFG